MFSAYVGAGGRGLGYWFDLRVCMSGMCGLAGVYGRAGGWCGIIAGS